MKDSGDARVLNLVRKASQLWREQPPQIAATLRKHVTVLCEFLGIDPGKISAAAGGEVRQDFAYFRLLALAFEKNEVTMMPVANAVWDHALRSGIKEGLFQANGPEAAAIYVRMAANVQQVPTGPLFHMRANAHRGGDADEYCLFPDQLYQRAAALSPHAEVFDPWLSWSKSQGKFAGERVAEAWRRACPGDIQPLLYLVEAKAGRNAYSDALKYLALAERIDSVNPQVRMHRLQLLTGNFINQLKRKKAHLAEETLRRIADLPAAREGDRPVFVAVLRALTALTGRDADGYNARMKEAVELSGEPLAAAMLAWMISMSAKLKLPIGIPEARMLLDEKRAAAPSALARTILLMRYFGVGNITAPGTYLTEAARQLPVAADSLDLAQIACLAENRFPGEAMNLAYIAAGIGMRRGGAAEARFLLARALSLPESQNVRRTVCLAAAVALADHHRDSEIRNQAIEELHREDASEFSLDLDEASGIAAQEKEVLEYPTARNPGPDYSDFAGESGGECDCPACRARRGEDDFDDSEDFDGASVLDKEELFEALDSIPLPSGIPAEFARRFIEEAKKAINAGKSPEEFNTEFSSRVAPEFFNAMDKRPEAPGKKQGKRK